MNRLFMYASLFLVTIAALADELLGFDEEKGVGDIGSRRDGCLATRAVQDATAQGVGPTTTMLWLRLIEGQMMWEAVHPIHVMNFLERHYRRFGLKKFRNPPSIPENFFTEMPKKSGRSNRPKTKGAPKPPEPSPG